jgi:hypothetical protein
MVTRTLIVATEPAKARTLYRRVDAAYEILTKGESVETVVKKFDWECLATVENNAKAMFSQMMSTKAATLDMAKTALDMISCMEE